MANKTPTPDWMRYLIIAWLLIALAFMAWGIVQRNWLATTIAAIAVVGNAVQLWRERQFRRVS